MDRRRVGNAKAKSARLSKDKQVRILPYPLPIGSPNASGSEGSAKRYEATKSLSGDVGQRRDRSERRSTSPASIKAMRPLGKRKEGKR